MPRFYTPDHEWIDIDGSHARVGITMFAQGQLGDITFVELPEVGATLTKGDSAAVIDSVKAASDVYAPAAGTVTAVNDGLADAPDLVNSAPESDGWLWDMTLADAADTAGLLDQAAYDALVAGL